LNFTVQVVTQFNAVKKSVCLNTKRDVEMVLLVNFLQILFESGT